MASVSYVFPLNSGLNSTFLPDKKNKLNECCPTSSYIPSYKTSMWPGINAYSRDKKSSFHCSPALHGRSFKKSKLTTISFALNGGESTGLPGDYVELIHQAKEATAAALADGKLLLEIEFPTGGLDSVSGDTEGGIEMTESMRHIREFCKMFLQSRQGSSVRIFFPDVNEVTAAKGDIFEGVPFQLDYLTQISGFEDLGFSKKARMKEKVREADNLFLVAYPYFNVNEMLAVEELHRDVAMPAGKPIVVFNGEMDRIRSGYYPSLFYPKLGALARNFLPLFDSAYYLHNFKGRSGGKLFRAYPGPWQVYRGGNCIHQQDSMPSLKEVALSILT